jgi:hypothetical protein
VNFGEIDIARATGNANLIQNTAINCNAKSYAHSSEGRFSNGSAANISTVDAAPLYQQRWVEIGYPDPSTQVAGHMTAIRFPDPVAAVNVSCPVPATGHWRQSLSTWALVLPAVQGDPINGGTDSLESIMVEKAPNEFIVEASFNPDIIDTTQFIWTTDLMNTSATSSSTFLTTSTPAMQQQSDYRTFTSGSLVGLASGFLVALIQQLLERRR